MPTTNYTLKFRDWVWLNRPEKTTYTFAKALRDIENNCKLYQIFKQQTTNMTNTKFQILSPDGFQIDPETEFYNHPNEVLAAYLQFVSRFITQGYYSQICNDGHKREISLNNVSDYCTIIESTTGEEDYLSNFFEGYGLLESSFINN